MRGGGVVDGRREEEGEAEEAIPSAECGAACVVEVCRGGGGQAGWMDGGGQRLKCWCCCRNATKLTVGEQRRR